MIKQIFIYILEKYYHFVKYDYKLEKIYRENKN